MANPTKTTIVELPPKPRARAKLGLAIVDYATSWVHFTAADKQKIADSGLAWIDARLRSPGSGKILADARAMGLELRGHDWDGETPPGKSWSIADEASGRVDGYKAAVRAIAAGVSVYSANFEVDVWRGEKPGYANPHADEYMEAFFDAFDERTRGTGMRVRYLGFSNPEYFYKTSDLDLDGHPDNTIPGWLLDGRIEGCSAMVYQGQRTAIRKTLDRARKVWSDKLVEAYAGTGRVDAAGDCIGNDAAWTEIAKAGEVPAISFYVGYTAKDNRVQPWETIVRGSKWHRPIVDLARDVLTTPAAS